MRLRPLPYKDPGRLVCVTESAPEDSNNNVSSDFDVAGRLCGQHFYIYGQGKALASERAMNLTDWRYRIDEIDKKLLELLNERSRCAVEVGKLKLASNAPLLQPDRENDVLDTVESNNSGPLTNAAIRRLFRHIIDEVRGAERDALDPEAHSNDGRKMRL